jgi:hypothetical protein
LQVKEQALAACIIAKNCWLKQLKNQHVTKTLLDGLDMLSVEASSHEAAESKRQTESAASDMALVAVSTIRLRLGLPLN